MNRLTLFTIIVVISIINVHCAATLKCKTSSSRNDPNCRCREIQGSCMHPSRCRGSNETTRSGLCLGSASDKCCIAKQDDLTHILTSSEWAHYYKNRSGINLGLNACRNSYLMSQLGSPGKQCLTRKCTYTSPCSCSGAKGPDMIRRKLDNGINLYGLPAIVEAINRVFDKLKIRNRRVWNYAQSSGQYCCRGIKRKDGTLSSSFSDHSWGSAIDLRFSSGAQRKTERGIALMAPIFEEEKFYWLAGKDGTFDAMHFSVSKELISSLQQGCPGGVYNSSCVSTSPVYGYCNNKGRQGECLRDTVCSIRGGNKASGLCPGNSRIKCCTNMKREFTPITDQISYAFQNTQGAQFDNLDFLKDERDEVMPW